jgi:hypothetical protein
MTEKAISAFVLSIAANMPVTAETLRSWGVYEIRTIKDDAECETGLAVAPDVAIVVVPRGGEMLAFRVGQRALRSGAAVVFVVGEVGTPLVESLTGGVVGAIAVSPPMSPREFSVKVDEALTARASADHVARCR